MATNYSNAYNSRAKLMLANRPTVEFWIKEFNLPDLSTEIAEIPSQPYPIKVENGQLTYGSLTLSLFIDESFDTYIECYNWIIGTSPLSEAGYVDPKTNATLLVLNNSLTKPVMQFMFEDAILTSISSLSYNNYGDEELLLDLDIAYTKFYPLT